MPNQNPDVKLAYNAIAKRRSTFEKFYKYYKGEHGLNFASDKYLEKFLERLQNLNVNLCKRVVNAPVSRLEILGFASDDKAVTESAWTIWKRSKMPLKSKGVHREAFRTGRAFVLVWVDPKTKKARIYPQSADTCHVWRDSETDEVTKAAKVWRDAKKWRLNLYYPDRIEKYETGAYFTSATGKPTSSEVFTLVKSTNREPNPVANPWGIVPIFEFMPLEGESFLSDVLPINDDLNKTVADIAVGREYNTIRQRYTAGVVFESDPETQKPIITFKHDDSIWSADDPEAKFGEFSDLSLEPFLKTEAQIKLRVAQVTGIPAHFFNLGTGDFPSGEALETAESPFVSLVEDAQLAFGETWGEVLSFCFQIDRALPGELELEITWTDAGRPGLTKKLAHAVIKQALGVSPETYLAELGYTIEQIKQFSKDNKARSTALGSTLGAIFDRGGASLSDEGDAEENLVG